MTTPALPPKAQLKITALQDFEEEANILLLGTQRKIGELSRRLDLNPHGSEAPGLEAEIDRLKDKQIEQQDKYRERAFLNMRIRTWLASLQSGVGLETAKIVKPKLKKDEPLSATVARIREEIAALQSEYRKVQQAGPTLAELKTAVKEYVKRQAARGRPRILADHKQFSIGFDANVENANIAKTDIAAVLTWLFPAEMMKRLGDELTGMTQQTFTLSADEKFKRLSDLTMRIAELELHEEALIVSALDHGQQIVRRPDADPAALLGVSIVRKSKAVAA